MIQRESLVFSSLSRLIIGFLLISIVSASYILKLDILLLILIVFLVTYDFYQSKIVSLYFLLLFLFVTIFIFNFFNYSQLKHLYAFEIILIIFSIPNSKYKKYFFVISLYIFCLILFYISNYERYLLYIIILASFLNDTIAFIIGKNIGGPLIIPSISPKKTWSGTLVSFFLTTVFLLFLDFNILLASISSLFLFLGDIFFSHIKRYLNLKDFSLLLKDHGGILDRLDSMFFVAIIFQVFIVFFK